MLFRAAAHEAPRRRTAGAASKRCWVWTAPTSLRYADKQKGPAPHRAAGARTATQAELEGFVLAGDTSAEAWIKTLLQDELPAQAYGRLLLVPGAKPPVAVQSRGKPVCTCFNVTDTADRRSIWRSRRRRRPTRARLASLQDALKCGTNCGSCVPELKRMVRAAPATRRPTAPQRRAACIPIRQQA